MYDAGVPDSAPNSPDGIEPVKPEQERNVLSNITTAGAPDSAPNRPDGIEPVKPVQF